MASRWEVMKGVCMVGGHIQPTLLRKDEREPARRSRRPLLITFPTSR